MNTTRSGSTTAKTIGAAALIAIILGIAGSIGALILTISVPATMIAAVTGGDQDDGPTKPPGKVPGIDQTLLKAFNNAVATESKTCKGIRWQILAGVGQIESHLGQGVTITATGDTNPHIVGIDIGADSDNGKWDGDPDRDHAVGILQIIPTSWQIYGADGNNDGHTDPNNVFDNALGSARHLCGTSKGIDLSTDDGLTKALYAYNHSDTYVAQVKEAIATYDAQSDDDGDGGEEFTGTCSVDTNLPRTNPNDCAEAIKQAKALTDKSCIWYQLCLGFTAVVYGWNVSGVYSAWEQWKLLDAGGYTRTDRNPPPGALVFWKGSGVYGHIAISVGGGKIASNDISRSGCIDIVDWDAPETQWGQQYLGWSVPYFPNGS